MIRRCILFLLLLPGVSLQAQDGESTVQEQPPAVTETPPNNADATPAASGLESSAVESSALEAVRDSVRGYVEAFNRADAEALVAYWSDSVEYVTPGGEVIRGKEQLLPMFTKYFQNNPGVMLELAEVQFVLLSPRVATETGFARIVGPESETLDTRYEAVHVLGENGWKMDSLREADTEPTPLSNYERLKPLEWMIGTWVDQSADGTIETSGRWTTNATFIVRTFRVSKGDQLEFEGTQVIGWDPSIGAIRSWTFDSDGGFGVGRWSGEGNRWTVQALSVLPDGRRGSSTNIYELMDNNRLTFKSIGRQVDGELMPSIGPVEVVRAQ